MCELETLCVLSKRRGGGAKVAKNNKHGGWNKVEVGKNLRNQ